MTWEETIVYIRSLPKYRQLVRNAYFGEDLKDNVERFRKSGEFQEALRLIKKLIPSGSKILDIGSGNGISSVAFALEGFLVTSVEPDGSDTIGAGAIRKLKKIYDLENLTVHEAFAEDLAFDAFSFDVVYVRQAMHHANNLADFIAESARVLVNGGILMTIRDHVIYNEADKQLFLKSHPLHKYYGGENAFTRTQYRQAMLAAGLDITHEFKYFDSILNYWPTKNTRVNVARIMHNTIGLLPQIIWNVLPTKISRKIRSFYDEKYLPGRVYSYIAKKGILA